MALLGKPSALAVRCNRHIADFQATTKDHELMPDCTSAKSTLCSLVLEDLDHHKAPLRSICLLAGGHAPSTMVMRPDAERGRGLALVDAFSNRRGWHPTRAAGLVKVVWVESASNRSHR